MSQLSPEQCFQQIHSLLQRQTVEIDGINDYLADIKTKIAEGDTEQLSGLLNQQRLPLAEIDDLENQRHRLLELFGFAADRDGLIACIQWCDQTSELSGQYQSFEQALLRLQHSIKLNSLLVNKGQKRIRERLHLLTGQPTTSDSTRTYSSSGHTDDLNSKRSIAQA